MSERKDKFSKELDLLITEGERLYISMLKNCNRDAFDKYLEDAFGDNISKKEDYTKLLPNFKIKYQEWYSKSLAVIRFSLPDRVSDFESYYEYKKLRKSITFQNYMIKDYLQGLLIRNNFGETMVDGSAAIPEFSQQLNMLRAAKSALDSVLMDMKAIVQADLFDSEIEATRVLAKAGYLRAAGAICGVVIEKHLLHICATHGVVVKKKNPSISELSQSLREADITTIPQWRFIQHLADIRNICDHAKGRDPSKSEIEDLIDGTDKILETVF